MAKKIQKRSPSILQRKTIDIMVATGGKRPVSKAMREAGYSEAMARNSHKLTKSQTYKDYLEAAGLTSEYLSEKHQKLSRATRLEKDTFHAEPIYELKGKKEVLSGWKNLSDEKIRLLIEGTEEDPTGNKLAYIKKYEKHRDVFFRVPDSVVQSKAIDMAYKVRGDYTADRAFEDLASHIIGKEEEEEINGILNKNKR